MEIYAHPRGYEVEVASLGGLPSALHAEDYSFGTGYALLRRAKDDDATWDPRIVVIGGVIHRYLQRGSAAPPTLNLEEAACRAAGLEPKLERAGKDSEEVGYQKWEGENIPPERLHRAVAMGDGEDATPPELEPSLRESLLGSEEERRFLEWACRDARASCGGRLLPQVLFGDLGTGSEDVRRADFVYSDGVGQPIVIEIDGIQHEETTEADESRDEALEGLGLEVWRIPTSALKGTEMEDAPGLGELESIWKGRIGDRRDDEEGWAKATRWIQEGTALQAALTSLWMRNHQGSGGRDSRVGTAASGGMAGGSGRLDGVGEGNHRRAWTDPRRAEPAAEGRRPLHIGVGPRLPASIRAAREPPEGEVGRRGGPGPDGDGESSRLPGHGRSHGGGPGGPALSNER